MKSYMPKIISIILAVAQYKNATMASVQYFYSFANEVGISFS